MPTDIIRLIDRWPQPAVPSETQLHANEHSLTLRYLTANAKTALLHFPRCTYLAFGAPNDEALAGHPLASHGLKFYSIHEVHDSSLIHLLESRNAVHPRHDRTRFLNDNKHYIFTFQDSSLELVITEKEHFKPVLHLCNTPSDAAAIWSGLVRS